MSLSHQLATFDHGTVEITVPHQFPRHYGFCVTFGIPRSEPLVRVHSRCSYSEVLGSLHCDCVQQLHSAIDMIKADGGGLLFYLDQEGRGAGIEMKARAYREIEGGGKDSFSFYHSHAGLEDLRDYRPVGQFLSDTGFTEIRLMTGNPLKVDALRKSGLHCRRVPLKVEPPSPHAAVYMSSKRARGYDI